MAKPSLGRHQKNLQLRELTNVGAHQSLEMLEVGSQSGVASLADASAPLTAIFDTSPSRKTRVWNRGIALDVP